MKTILNSRTISLSIGSRIFHLRAGNAKDALLWLHILIKYTPASSLGSIFDPIQNKESSEIEEESHPKRTPYVKTAALPLNNGESFINVHGWLKKRGRINTAWQARYFALWNLKILYYFKSLADCEEFLSGDSPNNSAKGLIDLTKATRINFSKMKKTILIIRTPSRKWQLQAANANDAKQWYDVLSRAITQSGNYLPHPTKIKKPANAKKRLTQPSTTSKTTKKKTDIDFDWDSFNNGTTLIGWRGWLWKLGKMRANWKRRYFALWNSKLFYYFLNEKLCDEFLSGSSSKNQSRGFIDLTTVTKLSVEKKDNRTVIKLATKERLWCISPTNDDFSKIWHILKLAKKSSR